MYTQLARREAFDADRMPDVVVESRETDRARERRGREHPARTARAAGAGFTRPDRRDAVLEEGEASGRIDQPRSSVHEGEDFPKAKQEGLEPRPARVQMIYGRIIYFDASGPVDLKGEGAKPDRGFPVCRLRRMKSYGDIG